MIITPYTEFEPFPQRLGIPLTIIYELGLAELAASNVPTGEAVEGKENDVPIGFKPSNTEGLKAL